MIAAGRSNQNWCILLLRSDPPSQVIKLRHQAPRWKQLKDLTSGWRGKLGQLQWLHLRGRRLASTQPNCGREASWGSLLSLAGGATRCLWSVQSAAPQSKSVSCAGSPKVSPSRYSSRHVLFHWIRHQFWIAKCARTDCWQSVWRAIAWIPARRRCQLNWSRLAHQQAKRFSLHLIWLSTNVASKVHPKR